jgi:hypothetical protein
MLIVAPNTSVQKSRILRQLAVRSHDITSFVCKYAIEFIEARIGYLLLRMIPANSRRGRHDVCDRRRQVDKDPYFPVVSCLARAF